VSTVWVSSMTFMATAAAISDGLNSKKSIPALNPHHPNYHPHSKLLSLHR